MQITNIIVGEKALYTTSPTVAKQLNDMVAKGSKVANMPGGPVNDIIALVENIKNMVEDGVKFEWRDAPKKKISQSQALTTKVSQGVLDMTPYQELKALSSSDQANVMFMCYFKTIKSMLVNDSSVGSLVHTMQQMTNSLGMVLNAKTSVNCQKMSTELGTLVDKLDFESAAVHLQKKTVQYKVITTFQALIEFSSHDGTTLYYLNSGNYLLEIAEQTMEIHSLGYIVRQDQGFNEELLKVGYKIAPMSKDEARAVLTLSKVLEVKRDGDDCTISFSTAIPGVVAYPGFDEYSLINGGAMKACLNPILRTKKTVLCESGWYSYSVHVLALRKFFLENLGGDLKYVQAVEEFLDSVCTIDPVKLNEKLTDMLKSRRSYEKDVLGFLQDARKCIDYVKKANAVMSVFGVSGSGSFPYTEQGTKKVLKYPTFEENADRLKAGRFSRNSDPRKFLHKQYPIVENGPAAVMGDATADKWERILATLKAISGGDVLSRFGNFLYAGVTNNDRMLGGVCKAWIESRANAQLSDLVLLDRNTPNSAKWNLKYGEHEFKLRSPQCPEGEFVSMDLIKYLDSLDTSEGKTAFLFSDANVLSTDDENFHSQNEFVTEGIDLGHEGLTKWIVDLKGATPNGVAFAKYIFKCASKFKAGVLKVHMFKVSPGFVENVMAKLYDVFKVDSLLWKEGRGHNPEYFFYFFPPTQAVRPYHKCTWIMPVLTACAAVSELTRHVSFYCPHRLEGHSTIGETGILGHATAFPVIFPSTNVRQFSSFEINGKKYQAIKNIRVGTQSLVAGIANDTDGGVDLDSMFAGVPPPPKEETTEFEMSKLPPETERKIIRSIKKTPQPTKVEVYTVDVDLEVQEEVTDIGEANDDVGEAPGEVVEEPGVSVVDDDTSEDEKKDRLNTAFD